MRVEVLQHAAPLSADRAVGLVDNDQVEGFRRDVWVVGDRDGSVRGPAVEARPVSSTSVARSPENALDRGRPPTSVGRHRGRPDATL